MDVLSSVVREALQLPPSASKTRDAFNRAQSRMLRKGAWNVDCSFTLHTSPHVTVSCLRHERDTKAVTRERNGAIPIIFAFYSKMQIPSAQLAQRGITYEEIKNCNERISLFELLTFCRDFGIVPRLISKQNVNFIWKICLAEHNRSTNKAHFRHTDMSRGQLRDAGIDKNEFLGVLARIALVAYADAALGAPQLAVDKLVDFLQLNDLSHIRHVIRTTGRETQGRLYGRSQGEHSRGTSRAVIKEGIDFLVQKNRTLKQSDGQFTESALARMEKQPRWAEQMTTAISNNLTLTQQVMLAQYDKNLTDYLQGICSSISSQHWVPFKTLGIDLAAIPRENSYRARLEITNTSSIMLVVSGLRRQGNIAPSVSVAFDPSPFASGLSRIVDLTIKPNFFQEVECTGILEVTISSAEGEKSAATLELPIYYRLQPGRCQSASQEKV